MYFILFFLQLLNKLAMHGNVLFLGDMDKPIDKLPLYTSLILLLKIIEDKVRKQYGIKSTFVLQLGAEERKNNEWKDAYWLSIHFYLVLPSF